MRKTSITVILLLAVAPSLPTLAVEAGRYDYTFLTVGEPSGSQHVRYDGEGNAEISFEFNDRGRGPETRATLRLNEDGLPVAVDIEGKNYLKGEISEHFSIRNGVARWESNVETGEAAFDGGAFYLPVNAPPEMMAILARALLASKGGTLALLPTGAATISELAHSTLVQDGAEKQVTLYGISGINTSPSYVWLDADGSFFGADFGWFGITREGYEEHINVLKDAQSNATDEFFERLARDLTMPIDGQLVIRGARLFDSLTGTLTAPATVFVWDGRITAVYFDDVPIPPETSLIDAAGKTLLPALWDMHAHVSIDNYLNYLAAGVTNVRDMANDPDRIFKLGADVRSGRIAGPDVYALGFIDKRGEFSAPTGRLADTLQDAMDLVDYYARHGFLGIKLYSSIEPGWVAPIADYAHERGLVVMGHVPAYMNARQAIDAGYDEITHINMILLNFLGGEELDTRTPTRFVVPGEKAGDLSLDAPAVRQFIDRMRAGNIAHDPTLSIFMDMFLNEPGKVSPVFRDIADHLPASVRRASIASTGFNDGKEEAFARAAATSLRMVKRLHDSGIRILPGTDNSLPGFTLIRELRYYAEAGIPAGEVLQLATLESARHLGQDGRLGSVSVGKEAQLFLVDGDPLADLNALYRVREVIKGRRMYYAPALLEAQGFKPFTD